MSITGTIAIMGTASVASVIVEKILYETGKANNAQYVGLFTSASLGAMALATVYKLIQFIATM